MINFARLLGTAAIFAMCAHNTALAFPAMPTVPPGIANPNIVKVDGCHGSVRYHYVPQIDQAAEHRHRGGSCIPVIIEGGGGGVVYEHCHENGQRHSHSGFGRTTHSHYGRNCRVEVWEEYQGNRPGSACVRVGPVTFCP